MSIEIRMTILPQERGIIAEAVHGMEIMATVHLTDREYWSPNPAYSMQTVKRKLAESIADPVKRFVVERELGS